MEGKVLQNEGVLLFMQLMGILFIIFLAYVGTKWLSKKYSRVSMGKNMKVLERISLGPDKSIVLVTVGKKAYLLGVSSKGIDALRDIDECEIEQVQENNIEKTVVLEIFNDLSKKCNSFGSSIGGSIGNSIGNSVGSVIKDYYIKNGRNSL